MHRMDTKLEGVSAKLERVTNSMDALLLPPPTGLLAPIFCIRARQRDPSSSVVCCSAE